MNTTTKSIVHGFVSVGLFAIPFLLMSNNSYLDLTIGGVLNAAYHWLVMYSATL